ncbi:hypothetical protein Tco_1247489 [Tanacetum coccineum]
MDDEPMWAANRVIALTPGSAITLPATANEFAIKDTKNEVVRLMMFPLSLTREAKTCEATQKALNAAAGGIFLYYTPNQAYQLLEDKVLLKLDWEKNQKSKPLKRTVTFVDEGPNNTDTDKIMARIDVMTMKIDAQYKELQSRPKQSTTDHNDDIPMSHKEEAKFMQTFHKTHGMITIETTIDPMMIYDIQKQLNNFMKAQQSTNAFVKEQFMDLKTQIEGVVKNQQASIQKLEAKFDRLADKQSGRPSGSLPSNTQSNPKGSSSKPYQPSQARNEHVNVVFTRSGKTYDPPINPNDQNNPEPPINFDSDDEDKEPTPPPKTSKPVKEISTPKSYKPKVPYP